MASGITDIVSKGKLDGRISWSSTADKTNNKSTVVITLQAKKNTGTQATSGTWTGSTKIENTTANFSIKGVSVGTSKWVDLAKQTLVVDHNDNGTKTVAISGTINAPSGTSMAGTSVTISKTVTLDTIPRYFSKTPVITISTRTHNSIVFNWETSENCSEIKITGGVTTGITHTEVINAGKKTGTITFNGLEPGKTYSFSSTFKREDSGLTTAVTLQGNTVPNPSVISITYILGSGHHKSYVTGTLANEMADEFTIYVRKNTIDGTLFGTQTTASTTNYSVELDNETLYRSFIENGALIEGGRCKLAVYGQYDSEPLFIDYQTPNPDISKFGFYRTSPTSDTIKNQVIKGTFAGTERIAESTFMLQYRYREDNGGWSVYQTIPIESFKTRDIKFGTFELDKDAITISGLDYSKTCTIELAVSDNIMTTPLVFITTVSRGKPPWWTTKDYLGADQIKTKLGSVRDKLEVGSYDDEESRINYGINVYGQKDVPVHVQTSRYKTSLLIGASGVNRGIYDFDKLSSTGDWVIYNDANNITRIPHSTVGDYIRTCLGTDYTISTAKAWATLPLTEKDGGIGSSLTISGNGVKIGKGVKAVRVSCSVYFYTGSTAEKNVRILLGTTAKAIKTTPNVAVYTSVTLDQIIEVTENQIIYLQVYAAAATQVVKDYNNETYLTVEVIKS